MAAEAKVPAEAVHKEYFAEKMGTDDGSGETKKVDLTTVAKETAVHIEVHSSHRRFCRGNRHK